MLCSVGAHLCARRNGAALLVFGQLVHGKDLAGRESVNALDRGGIIASHGKRLAATCLGGKAMEEKREDAALNSIRAGMRAASLSLLDP